jgi:hypothetical protein
MFNWLQRFLTNNKTEIPLIIVTFNHKKYKKECPQGSCDVKMHPSLTIDQELKEKIKAVIDHIRSHSDMDSL